MNVTLEEHLLFHSVDFLLQFVHLVVKSGISETQENAYNYV